MIKHMWDMKWLHLNLEDSVYKEELWNINIQCFHIFQTLSNRFSPQTFKNTLRPTSKLILPSKPPKPSPTISLANAQKCHSLLSVCHWLLYMKV